MFKAAIDSKCVLWLRFLLLKISFIYLSNLAVDVNQTLHNETKYYFESAPFAYWQEQTKHYHTSLIWILMLPFDSLSYIFM